MYKSTYERSDKQLRSTTKCSRNHKITKTRNHEITNEISELVGCERCVYANTSACTQQAATTSAHQRASITSAHQRAAITSGRTSAQRTQARAHSARTQRAATTSATWGFGGNRFLQYGAWRPSRRRRGSFRFTSRLATRCLQMRHDNHLVVILVVYRFTDRGTRLRRWLTC